MVRQTSSLQKEFARLLLQQLLFVFGISYPAGSYSGKVGQKWTVKQKNEEIILTYLAKCRWHCSVNVGGCALETVSWLSCIRL